MKKNALFAIFLFIHGALLTLNNATLASGSLRVCPDNPRYFTDESGKAIYLTGSHVWNNLVDMGPSDPPPAFDFDRYLQWMQELNHNFIRLWRWELVSWNTEANDENKTHFVEPHPWLRAGTEKALDGKPKFDLTQFNPAYFDRLRSRVRLAGEKGIYVSVMLFEGWGVQFIEDGFKGHPFHKDNNVNQIDGDPNQDGMGFEIYELSLPEVTRIQEAYVQKLIDTVNDLDNVLYEISNENHPPSTLWQYHMIDFVHTYEKNKPKQHPVGMTFQYKGGAIKTCSIALPNGFLPIRKADITTILLQTMARKSFLTIPIIFGELAAIRPGFGKVSVAA